ncbi:hypothetical protein H1R20_g4245, partial [Candolleomyces eurysporus]
MNQSSGQRPSIPSHRRPATIPELAERALIDLSDDKAKLKDYLRIAEKYRKEGKELIKQGDLEAAFVLLAKAATLVLEKLPKHRDYYSLLNDEQQNNLALNGQEILDQLGELKKALLERYEQWQRLHPDGEDQELTPNAKLHSPLDDRDDPSPTRTEMDFSRLTLEDPRLRDQSKRAAEEANRWRIQREEAERRDTEIRDNKRAAAVAAARQAAHAPAAYGSQHTTVISDPNARHHPQPDEIRRRESEDMKRRAEQMQRGHGDAMMRRQQVADDQARAIRHNMVTSTTPAGIPISSMNTPTPTSSFYQQTPLYPPQGSHPPVTYPYPGGSGPAVMPLENPSSYEGDSTDSESVRYDRDFQRRMARHRSPSRAPVYNNNDITTSHQVADRLSNSYVSPSAKTGLLPFTQLDVRP